MKKSALNVTSKKALEVKPQGDPLTPTKESGYLRARTVADANERIKTYQDAPLTIKQEVITGNRGKTQLRHQKEPVVVIGKQRKPPYAFDIHSWQNSVAIHKLLLKWFNGISSDFNNLKIGFITLPIINDILSNNFAEVEKMFRSSIDESFRKATEVLPESVVNQLFEGKNLPLIEFKSRTSANLTRLDESKRRFDYATHFDVNNYTLEDGVFSFSDQQAEDLKSHFSSYLDSDIKKEFVTKVKLVEKTIAELTAICRRNGIDSVFGYRRVWEVHPVTGELFYNKNIIAAIKK